MRRKRLFARIMAMLMLIATVLPLFAAQIDVAAATDTGRSSLFSGSWVSEDKETYYEDVVQNTSYSQRYSGNMAEDLKYLKDMIRDVEDFREYYTMLGQYSNSYGYVDYIWYIDDYSASARPLTAMEDFLLEDDSFVNQAEIKEDYKNNFKTSFPSDQRIYAVSIIEIDRLLTILRRVYDLTDAVYALSVASKKAEKGAILGRLKEIMNLSEEQIQRMCNESREYKQNDLAMAYIEDYINAPLGTLKNDNYIKFANDGITSQRSEFATGFNMVDITGGYVKTASGELTRYSGNMRGVSLLQDTGTPKEYQSYIGDPYSGGVFKQHYINMYEPFVFSSRDSLGRYVKDLATPIYRFFSYLNRKGVLNSQNYPLVYSYPYRNAENAQRVIEGKKNKAYEAYYSNETDFADTLFDYLGLKLGTGMFDAYGTKTYHHPEWLNDQYDVGDLLFREKASTGLSLFFWAARLKSKERANEAAPFAVDPLSSSNYISEISVFLCKGLSSSNVVGAIRSICLGDDYIKEIEGREMDRPGVLESGFASLLTGFGRELEDILSEGGLTLEKIVYGRVNTNANTNILINRYGFELREDNVYGLIGAITYTVLRSVLVFVLILMLMAGFTKNSFVGGNRFNMKESVVFGAIILTAMYATPNLIDIAIYVRDVALKLVYDGFSDVAGQLGGSPMTSLAYQYYKSAQDSEHIIDAVIYLSIVGLTAYYAFSYASMGVTMILQFGFFPLYAVVAAKDKRIISQWCNYTIGILVTPIVDSVLLFIPMISGANVFHVPIFVQIVLMMSLIPARGTVRQMLGVGASIHAEAAGLGTMMVAGRAALMAGRAVKNTVSGLASGIRAGIDDYSKGNLYGSLDRANQEDSTEANAILQRDASEQAAFDKVRANEVFATRGADAEGPAEFSRSQSHAYDRRSGDTYEMASAIRRAGGITGGATSLPSTQPATNSVAAAGAGAVASAGAASFGGSGAGGKISARESNVYDQLANYRNFDAPNSPFRGKLSNAKMAELYKKRAKMTFARTALKTTGSALGGAAYGMMGAGLGMGYGVNGVATMGSLGLSAGSALGGAIFESPLNALEAANTIHDLRNPVSVPGAAPVDDIQTMNIPFDLDQQIRLMERKEAFLKDSGKMEEEVLDAYAPLGTDHEQLNDTVTNWINYVKGTDNDPDAMKARLVDVNAERVGVAICKSIAASYKGDRPSAGAAAAELDRIGSGICSVTGEERITGATAVGKAYISAMATIARKETNGMNASNVALHPIDGTMLAESFERVNGLGQGKNRTATGINAQITSTVPEPLDYSSVVTHGLEEYYRNNTTDRMRMIGVDCKSKTFFNNMENRNVLLDDDALNKYRTIISQNLSPASQNTQIANLLADKTKTLITQEKAKTDTKVIPGTGGKKFWQLAKGDAYGCHYDDRQKHLVNTSVILQNSGKLRYKASKQDDRYAEGCRYTQEYEKLLSAASAAQTAAKVNGAPPQIYSTLI